VSLSPMTQLLRDAAAGDYAVGAFTVWNLESVYAIMQTAERLKSPVILQAGPAEAEHAGWAQLSWLALDAIRAASVPAVLNLDHGDTFESAVTAIDNGFGSVMIDVSQLPFEENVAETRRVVEYAHARGVEVEGELGRVGGAEAGIEVSDAEATQTDPDEAVEFVARTGIDTLAVAIGNAHGFYQGRPRINLDRLAQIRAKVPVPLVLHGGSSTPKDILHRAIDRGIAKINICTEFVSAFLQTYQAYATTPPTRLSIPAVFGPPRERGMELVEAKMRLFKSVGQA